MLARSCLLSVVSEIGSFLSDGRSGLRGSCDSRRCCCLARDIVICVFLLQTMDGGGGADGTAADDGLCKFDVYTGSRDEDYAMRRDLAKAALSLVNQCLKRAPIQGGLVGRIGMGTTDAKTCSPLRIRDMICRLR